MMALILAEHSPTGIELSRVIKMLLIHDIVEIDAGDTSIYDSQASLDKTTREMQGANRIFGLLPEDQAKGFLEIWEEFEAGKTRESKFARALDRLMPLLHNYHTQGKRWKQDGITYEQVIKVNQSIKVGSPKLWELALSIIDDCVEEGYLTKK
jgi:putative hydrolase of HD superfamily